MGIQVVNEKMESGNVIFSIHTNCGYKVNVWIFYFPWWIRPLVLSYKFLYIKLDIIKTVTILSIWKDGGAIQPEFFTAKERHPCSIKVMSLEKKKNPHTTWIEEYTSHFGNQSNVQKIFHILTEKLLELTNINIQDILKCKD